MGDMVGLVIRSMVLSFMMSVSCQAFFETTAPRRKLRFGWMEHMIIPAFVAGFMIIAVAKIPPYVLQPVRVVAVLVIVVQIFFQIGIVRNLILSVMFCGTYWIISALFIAVVNVIPAVDYRVAEDLLEPVVDAGFLGLMLLFRFRYQKRVRGLPDIRWGKFGFFSLAGIIVSMTLTAGVMSADAEREAYYARLAAVAGFTMIYVIGFYYMVSLIEKESQVQRLRLVQERIQNQMNLYQGMKQSYEQQRRYQHDFRNQLNCIQGLIESGQIKEALDYIAGLTGSLRLSEMCVNTNHVVVNVLLNQKYAEAYDKGIAMTMAANNLSGLMISEEDLVTLLGNLLDNAIEACGKLEQNRVIQFKMVLEEGQVILSIRNPVKDPVRIRDNSIVTSKHDKSMHGIGLLNVDSVIRKNGGTSVLQCENGWFSFSAMIPATQ